MASPLEVVQDGRRLAGAYFTCLPGKLAMLGAVRVCDGFDQFGVLLLTTLVNRLCENRSFVQIQAAVVERDTVSPPLLRSAGFRSLATVDQLWLDLTQAVGLPKGESQLDEKDQGELEWTPATALTQVQFSDLLQRTFTGSLDCPELNGFRTSSDVLDSFLLGRSFDRVPHWEVAWNAGEVAGCLMLNEHPNEVVELAYMGLLPNARHRRLGSRIVQHAIERAIQMRNSMLVLGVDSRNHPAIKAYVRMGFQFHQRMQVLLFG